MAANSRGEGIADSLHLDFVEEVAEAVVVEAVPPAADGVAVVVLGVAVDDCNNILMIPSFAFGFGLDPELIAVEVVSGFNIAEAIEEFS